MPEATSFLTVLRPPFLMALKMVLFSGLLCFRYPGKKQFWLIEELSSKMELKFEGALSLTDGKQPQRGPSRGTGSITLSVSIYGPLSVAEQVGVFLAKEQTFLQLPYFVQPSCKGYFNPQLLGDGQGLRKIIDIVGLTDDEASS